MRLIKFILPILIGITLKAAFVCPILGDIKSVEFNTVPNESNWYQYYFLKFYGDTISFNGNWEVSALYAPVNISKQKIDHEMLEDMLGEVRLAQASIYAVSKISTTDEQGMPACYYKSKACDNVMFLALKN